MSAMEDVIRRLLNLERTLERLKTIEGGGGTPGGIGGSTGATDNAVLRANGTGGATLQNSLATIDDSGAVNIPTGQLYKINNAQHTHTLSDVTGSLDEILTTAYILIYS